MKIPPVLKAEARAKYNEMILSLVSGVTKLMWELCTRLNYKHSNKFEN